MDSLIDPHVLLDPVRDEHGAIVDFVYTYVNDAAIGDHRLTKEQLLGAHFSDLLPSEVDAGVVRDYARVIDTGEPYVANSITLADDTHGGALRTYDVRGIRVGGELMLSWRDVTDRERTIEALADSEMRFRMLAENATDLVFHVDADGSIVWVSPSAEKLLGVHPDSLVGTSGVALCEPVDQPEMIHALNRMRAGEMTTRRMRLRQPGGDFRWVEVIFRGIMSDDGSQHGGVAAVRDIHAEVMTEQALERAVTFDALTGLARRSLALQRIQEKLDEKRPSGGTWHLLCAGINGLSRINSAYTYAAGDEVIKAVAERLVKVAGAQDRVARIAGDEFVILFPDLQTPADAALAATVVLDAVRGPVHVGEAEVDVTVSVGIAFADSHTAQSLLRDATSAMWQTSDAGSDSWAFLDGNAGVEAQRVLHLQHDLRDELIQGRVQPWLMPIVDLKTQSVVGYEALARWIRLDGNVVYPDGFLAVAESSDIILDLDAAILRQACQALTVISQEQHIAVNLSPVTLALADVSGLVRAALEEFGVEPTRLHLEVTETSIVTVTDTIVAAMHEVSDMGVCWWIDDFGTGFSSLSHLRDLPIDGIKLDRDFVSAISGNGEEAGRSYRLAQGILGLAQGLGLQTVAEGVEDQGQAEVLTKQGWQLGQGWLYGKARPITDFSPSLQ